MPHILKGRDDGEIIIVKLINQQESVYRGQNHAEMKNEYREKKKIGISKASHRFIDMKGKVHRCHESRLRKT